MLNRYIYHVRCRAGEIGDEYHYLFICKNKDVQLLKNKYIPNYYKYNSHFIKMSGMLAFMSC